MPQCEQRNIKAPSGAVWQRRRYAIVGWTLCVLLALLTANVAKGIVPNYTSWDEARYQFHDDSVINALWPPVTLVHGDAPVADHNGRDKVTNKIEENTHVPLDRVLDKGKTMGQIPYSISVGAAGALMCNIPIVIPAGINGHTPELAFEYNSHGGPSQLGAGWHLSGVPSIRRVPATLYHDKCAAPVAGKRGDSLSLDGIRLLLESSDGDTDTYISETGSIAVQTHYSAGRLESLDAWWPDGTHGIFDRKECFYGSAEYLLRELSDCWGNTISYIWEGTPESPRLRRIEYGGGKSLEFGYSTREDIVTRWCGGYRETTDRLLCSVTVKTGKTEIGTYRLSYELQNGVSVLSALTYCFGETSLNPLQFTYGTGEAGGTLNSDDSLAGQGYATQNAGTLSVRCGTFDYHSGEDGLLTWPTKTPYYQHYRHATAFRHSESRFKNLYDETGGKTTILIYTGLAYNTVYTHTMEAGKGFIDILCLDSDGARRDKVVKINNIAVDVCENLTLKWYEGTRSAGLSEVESHTYNLFTHITDGTGERSVQPKFYMPCDLDGDGKQEILAVSVHEPFGTAERPSECIILEQGCLAPSFQGHVFDYRHTFVGTEVTDATVAADNSDRVFTIDVDGDGKSEVCHIHSEGCSLYKWSRTNRKWSVDILYSTSMLSRKTIQGREIMPGDFNGDGLADLLVSPSRQTPQGTDWTFFISRGDGHFEEMKFTGPPHGPGENALLLTQDVNFDGMTDLLVVGHSWIKSYLCTPAGLSRTGSLCSLAGVPSVAAMDVKVQSRKRTVAAVCGTTVSQIMFGRDDSREQLLTGVSDCLGVNERITYRGLSDRGPGDAFITVGNDAKFPYINLYDPLPLVSKRERFVDGRLDMAECFSYENPVAHFQGLGFCGFTASYSYDDRGKYCKSRFNPYAHSAPVSVETERASAKYKSITYGGSGKPVRVEIHEKENLDKLTGVRTLETTEYDGHGYPVRIASSTPDGRRVTQTLAYSHSPTPGPSYGLGYCTKSLTEYAQGGKTYSEQTYIPAHSHRSPVVELHSVNGKTVSERRYEYDSRDETEMNRPFQTDWVYLFGDCGTAPMAFRFGGGYAGVVHLARDYLGSVRAVVGRNEEIFQENAYDAWGRMEDVNERTPLDDGAYLTFAFHRGFLGEEHLPWHGLVNLNARLYDPVTGRFLSQDPYIHPGDDALGYNPYAYCLQNPLKYTDKDGEFFWAAVGLAALAGGAINVATHWGEIQAAGGGWGSFWKGAAYFGAGALAGGVGMAAGMGVASLLAPAAGGVFGMSAVGLQAASTGILPGAAVWGVQGAAEGFVQGTLNSVIGGNSIGRALGDGGWGGIQGGVNGALMGAAYGGYEAYQNGANLLKGYNYNSVASQNAVMLSANSINSPPIWFDNNYGKTWYGYFGYEDYQNWFNRGILRYVGITSQDPAARFAQHLMSGTNRNNLRFFVKKEFSSKLRARIWEQKMIMKYGMMRYSTKGQLFNLRNEIAPKYWKKFGIK